MIAIDSPANPRIRAAAGLRERRERLEAGATIVDGARECRRALEAGVVVEAAYTCPPLLRADDTESAAALAALAARAIESIEVSERAFAKLAFGDRADGIVLVVRTPSTDLDRLALGWEPLILVTEDVEKPGNLGAIVRTADAAGCDAVVAVGGTDLWNPNVIRASVGLAFTVPLAAADAATTIAWLHDRSIRIVATRVDAAAPYTDVDLTGPVAIVLGSEADGLTDAWSGPDIEAVSLPMLGAADSLNVSATAAILAYEARRQRDARRAAGTLSPGTDA